MVLFFRPLVDGPVYILNPSAITDMCEPTLNEIRRGKGKALMSLNAFYVAVYIKAALRAFSGVTECRYIELGIQGANSCTFHSLFSLPMYLLKNNFLSLTRQ